MLAADNVVPVVKDELTEAYGDELARSDEVSAALTTEELPSSTSATRSTRRTPPTWPRAGSRTTTSPERLS